MRAALDTNILVYAEDVNSPELGEAARRLVQRLPLGAGVIALQALGELYNVLTRKGGVAPVNAQHRVEHWTELLDTVPTNTTVLDAAIEWAVWSQMRIWDAIHLAAVVLAGCEVFLSERGGRDACTVGNIGAKSPRNSNGRTAPAKGSGAAPAGRGSRGPRSAERKRVLGGRASQRAERGPRQSIDLQYGFRWRGITVVNPFAHPDHPLLVRLLAASAT